MNLMVQRDNELDGAVGQQDESSRLQWGID